MILARITLRSLLNRRLTVALTILAIALSTALFLGVEKVRTGARTSFANTISGTDLIVGARSGSVSLLLYSVFRIGNATNNITWQSYQDIARHPSVAWAVPISLGDSHRGFRVLGTTPDYFEHYRYRGGRLLAFEQGAAFDDLFDTVVGADVAATLGYRLDDPMVVAHGLASFSKHDDKPFRVAGVLAKTGTPADRTVFVSLEGIEAIHIDWKDGRRTSGRGLSADMVRKMELTPKAVTAALVGVTSKIKSFQLQRDINTYETEPLLAILPGVALQELWEIVGVAESALIGVSVMVVITALLGMTVMIFSSLNERRREMAILRAVGARPVTVFGLLVTEAVFMTVAGVTIGVTVLYAGLLMARPVVDAHFGLYLPIDMLNQHEFALLGAVTAAGAFVSILPAFRAYRLSLADGMAMQT